MAAAQPLRRYLASPSSSSPPISAAPVLPSRFFLTFLPSNSGKCRMVFRHRMHHVPVQCMDNSVQNVISSGKSESAEIQFRAILFDMDGVLCDSEDRSRKAAVEYFEELGVHVKAEDFIPFMGTGEANFLGGVARMYGLANFDGQIAKKRFFEIYIEKYAKPNSGLGYDGALDLILECKRFGMKLAVASSADQIKVVANLAAAGLPLSNFDAIMSADNFERLKPAPDIFLAAAKALGIPPAECLVIEDALAGVKAAHAAGMRCIAVATTLPKEQLLEAGACFVKEDISHVKLDDILELQKQHYIGADSNTSDVNGVNLVVDNNNNIMQSPGLMDSLQASLSAEISLPAGYKTSRRQILKFSSLAVGLSCTMIVVSRWKAMSYASPKALLNMLFGIQQPPVARGSEVNSSERVEMFKKYISELEARNAGQQVLEFQPRLEWLNTTPLRLKRDLKGKVVILDFWTYCCINCMHVLPDLAYLEKKYKGKALTVVGVHSAKFDNEKDLEAIRNAVLRYDITHPVVNDGDMILWRQLGVNSWPTFVVLSPMGRYIGILTGEGHRQDLDDFVEAALQYYGERKLLDPQPIPQVLEKNKDTRLLSSPLSYPGKVATDLANGRLFISDSNHHRIIVTDLNGNFILQVGGFSDEGFKDGSFQAAAFYRPQGLAYNAAKNVLYVADTENHALREIDFSSEAVRTLAGNGQKGSDYKGGNQGLSQVLNSPWDVSFKPETGMLYIAMAGQHQIWMYEIKTGLVTVLSGDGYERNLNGQRGYNSSFSQPSGISVAPGSNTAYIADSESSSIRSVDLITGGSKLLAGGDPAFAENLFQFGDKDGIGPQAQFQHPLGVLAGTNGLVYIADSYNHKVKVLDPITQQAKTLAGTGVAGFLDGLGTTSQFSEPGGLAQGPNRKLFIADTNNNLIRILNLAEGQVSVETLRFSGVQPPQKTPRRLRRRNAADAQLVRVEAVDAVEGNLNLQISLPSGFHFSREAISKYDVDIEPENEAVIKAVNAGEFANDGHAILRFLRKNANINSTVHITCKIYYCQVDAVCLYKVVNFEVPFVASENQYLKDVPLKYEVTPPSDSNALLALN